MTLRTQNDPYVLVGDIADLPPPAAIAQGTIFHADDTSASYVLVIDQVTHARSWQAIVAPGGGLVEPLNQIVEGTGTGVTSSPLLTFNPAAAKFVASDLSDIPIFSVSGTPGARNAIVDDASGRTIWQILANNVSRTIAWVDETAALVMQAATIAATRTVTWFDETGTASVLALTLRAATASAIFGKTGSPQFIVDVANGLLLTQNASGVDTFGVVASIGELACNEIDLPLLAPTLRITPTDTSVTPTYPGPTLNGAVGINAGTGNGPNFSVPNASNVVLGAGDFTNFQAGQILRWTNAAGANAPAATTATIQAPIGTGTGTPGFLDFKAGVRGANGSLQHVLNTVTRMTGTGLAVTGGLAAGGGGPANADASAALQVVSTTQGFGPPSMTTVQKNAIVTSAGVPLIVFDSTLGKLSLWTGAAWQTVTSA